LDDYSILKEVTNALTRLTSQSFSSDTEKRFILLVNTLKIGCETSLIKTLPPINWFYLMSNLMKSQFGKANETNLFELTLMHLETLSSALGFFRNFLISLNTFNQFKVVIQIHNPKISIYLCFFIMKDETQHLILNNFNLIAKKFDSQLHLIVINKIKIYLNTLPSNKKDSILTSLINGFYKCFQDSKNIHINNQNQLKEFFEFTLKSHLLSYNPMNELMDKVVDCLILLNDDNITDRLLVSQINDFSRFQTISYIKFNLVSKGNQSLVFINDILEIFILNIDSINEEKENKFLQLLNKFVLNSYENIDELKFGHIDDLFTNWLVEFMSLLKNIATKTEEYSIKVRNLRYFRFEKKLKQLFSYD
jgi:hypothetical protein